jgi:hypothetical protein
MSFAPPTRIKIGSVDDETITVTAQFNPAQLEISQTVPWKKPESANKQNEDKGGKGGKAAKPGAAPATDNAMALEFTGAEGRSMTLELLFDGFENDDLGFAKKEDGAKSQTVADKVGVLETLATIRVPDSKKDSERIPHKCVVTYKALGKSGKFVCVIESLTTKYTMFAPDGTPLRATCTVKLKEAGTVTKAKEKK